MVGMEGHGSKHDQQTFNVSLDMHQQGDSKCFDDDGRPKRTGGYMRMMEIGVMNEVDESICDDVAESKNE
ncbi:hypothetical protein VIGAN_02139100 [Vigna angularis var. angularis]|uniref:Uncharacterized protein n=1 Tax=Vigna angularis var. angularis TaxID=157739 RepID=A0A0S3RDA7_PHAAN|nr:hypothetical protein VIGAN_02139100 [Vigna angularis var. angularis]